MRISSRPTERGTGAEWALVVATALAGLAAAALVALTPWHVPDLSGADRRGIGTAPGAGQVRAPAVAEAEPAVTSRRSGRCDDPAPRTATPVTGRRTLEG